jgi:hypothetical protein
VKVKALILPFIFLAVNFCLAQEMPVPRNLQQALKILQADCPDSLKAIIKITPEKKLIKVAYSLGVYGSYKTISNWISDDNKDIKLDKYLIKNGITDYLHKEIVILIAFRQRLLGQEVDKEKIFTPYRILEEKWRKEDDIRYTTDSLRGIYIPSDLPDCFKRLDKLLADSTKTDIKRLKEDDFIGVYFPLYIMLFNDWDFGSGSRLSRYFNDLGIHGGENMSGVILRSYHRYLLGQPINLTNQIKSDKDYWIKTDSAENARKKTEFSDYKMGDTVTYKYNYGYVTPMQQLKRENDKCWTKGIVIERNESKFYLKILITNACDPKGIITYDSKRTHVYDKKLRQWRIPKKKIIRRAKTNDENWFYYDEWYAKG